MKEKADLFNVLRKLTFDPDASQRDLAQSLGFSLGKLNYCLRALQQKGFIKIKNFSKKKNKIIYINRYVLTTKGINYRIQLTLQYMNRKIKEYEELKREVSKNK